MRAVYLHRIGFWNELNIIKKTVVEILVISINNIVFVKIIIGDLSNFLLYLLMYNNVKPKI